MRGVLKHRHKQKNSVLIYKLGYSNIIRTLSRNLGISRGEGALTLEFPGERCINLGISRGEVH
jgi:hypothetical protein